MRVRSHLAACLGLALLPASVPAAAGDEQAVDASIVRVQETEAGTLVSISARRAPVDRLLTRIAAETGLRLTGFERTARTALVDVELRDRPLPFALDAILGSVGLRPELRPGVIAVIENDTDIFTAEDLTDQAMAAYLRAGSRYADHPLAAAARLAQGKIEEARGRPDAALAHFETVIESYRASPEVSEAMMRAGYALEALKLWNDAAMQFQGIVGRLDAQQYAARARFELARCAEESGDHARALQILAALDSNVPPTDAEDETSRLLLRARALIGSDMHQAALRLLDKAEGIGMHAEGRHEALALRAAAFEGLGLPGEASRAWLIHSHEAVGKAREEALESAARLALQDLDELGVLFIYEQAERDGLASKLVPYAREARMRLGLDVRLQAGAGTIEDRLASVDSLLHAERYVEALQLLQPLHTNRSALDEEARTRVALGLALCLERTAGVDPAIEMLSEVRSEIELIENRRQLDRRAAELLEKNARFDEAIDAYQGRY